MVRWYQVTRTCFEGKFGQQGFVVRTKLLENIHALLRFAQGYFLIELRRARLILVP